ncbi:MAG: RIP metalloprotease RseP [Bacteroidaceae bacterium]|nr:RIP metalloprotease RseP [Bacteroidaceae bacterium]
MEIFFIKALQLILCFALLILLHEGGHFLFAKLFKIRVKKFCLFFDPAINLGFCRLSGTLKLFSWRGTDYHIGWIPLGGYVNIAGMIDESTSKEELEKDDTPPEQMFMHKPAWQRLLVMIGGVLVNFITALVIYCAILFTWGDTYTPIKNFEHGFKFNDEAKALGYQDYDIPLHTDAATFTRMDADFYRALSEANSVTVLRNGSHHTFNMPRQVSLLEITDTKTIPPFVAPLLPSIIDSVAPGTPAHRAGISAGDRLIGIDSVQFATWNDFSLEMSRRRDIISTASPTDTSTTHLLSVVVQRAGTDHTDTLQIQLPPTLQFGFYMHNVVAHYPAETLHYNLLQCIPAGIDRGFTTLAGYVSDLKYVFTAEGARSVGSFGTIGNLFPADWDWQRFWSLTAFISLILAVMNMLPIPALDGGHVFFLLVEIVTRRKPSEAFMEKAQMLGMVILFGLMALAIFNDCSNFGVFDIFNK